jgi:hypothetical protein
VEGEVAEWIEAHRHLHDEQGHRQVVRNGHLPQRTLLTGVGAVEVRQPGSKKGTFCFFRPRHDTKHACHV